MNPSPTKLVNLWDAAIRIITEPGEESKTEAKHENLIRGQYNQLLNNLTSVSEITAHMFGDGKITAKEREHIQQFHSTPIRASEELLNIIMKRSPDVYESFLRLLKNTKQDHVYQMLTITVEQNDYSGHESVSEHSRLIQQNYVWLTEKLNPDHSLLAVLLEKEVLSGRDYEQISSRKDTFKKNEILLSLISRKSSVDFKHFQEALNETLQSHINRHLTGAVADAQCENKLTAVDKTKTDSCSSSSGKSIPPKVPPKPERQLPVTSAQPKPLLAPGEQPTVSSRFKLVAVNHHTSIQRNVNMRQVYKVETQFKILQNEVQFEVSTKIAVLRKKGTNDNIWKICVEKILHESRQNRENLSRYKAIEETCDRLRQNILQEKSKLFTFQDEIQREKTSTEKQIRVLQEDKCHLEASLKSAKNDNEKLNKRLEESQIVVDNLKTLNQQIERKAAEIDKFHSMQLTELKEKLRVCDTEIYKLYQIEKELNNEVRKYKEMGTKHHQENYELKERNEALSTELDLNKRRLKELEGETSFYKQKLNETESRLRETEKKFEETEPNFKLNLKETEEQLKVAETELKETEARLTVAQGPLDETEAVATAEVELQDKLKSYPLLAHEAKRIATINTKKWIRGLALLDKELFVLSAGSSEIEVYNSMEFSRKWNLKELNEPLDIGSCNINKCLYILHIVGSFRKTEILRVAPNGNLINKLETGKMIEGNLSVTDESNVILTVLRENKLIEYSPDDKLSREIKLPSDAGITHPLHAIKLSNGHYLVSQGGKGNKRDLVCVVDRDGKLKKSVGTKLGPTIGLASYPVYLAVDRNGFVMVADQMNGRVLLLDSNLEFKREILSKKKHGLRGPFRILLDETNYQLFVADNQGKEGEILIFEFR